MPNAIRRPMALMAATTCAFAALGLALPACAQQSSQFAQNPILTLPLNAPAPSVSGANPIAQGVPGTPVRLRGPMARLVRNDDTSEGLPPFALADQAGVIQRYVEPVPSIDLNSYVGAIVAVRHDTGSTLLASQLELPPLPVDQSSGDEPRPEDISGDGSTSWASDVRRADFFDNDDATVELIDDSDTTAPSQAPGSSSPADKAEKSEDTDTSTTIEPIPSSMPPVDQVAPEAGDTFWLDGPMVESGTEFGGPFVAEGPFVDDLGNPVDASGAPWPGSPSYYENGISFDDFAGTRGLFARTFNSQNCRLFAEVDLMLMRLHLTENAAGKLSEQYELSPRVIVGFEGGDISDGRVRYWTYDHLTQLLEPGGGSVRFELNVVDIEATQRFQIRRSDIVVGAGLRLAKIVIGDDDGDEVGTDLYGMTVAADAKTYLCRYEEGMFSWVYGARLSILGGDWGGDAQHDLVPFPVRDDNVVTNELHAGIEYAFCIRQVECWARASFEMQNWRSDVFAGGTHADTISLLGPGIHLGAQF